MAALSDTPPPIKLTATSEAGGVSLKIEQGVLRKNDDFVGSGYSVVGQGISSSYYESSHPSDMDNLSNASTDDNLNIRSIYHPQVLIKTEPPVDIDDIHPEENVECDTNLQVETTNGHLNNIIPKIRVTPTSKLIATPNGGTANKRRYACPYENCTKSYGKSSHLRSHLTWHTGIKPFVCKEPGCGKGFTRSDELNRHTRTHTGEKPFECVQCTKKFSRSDHLTKHLATHTKQLSASYKGLRKKLKNFTQETQKAIPTVSTVAVEDKNQYSNISPISNGNNVNSELIVTEVKSADKVKTTKVSSLKIKLKKPDTNAEFLSVPHQQEIKTTISPIPTPAIQQIELNIHQECETVIKSEVLDEFHENYSSLITQSYDNEPDDDSIMPEANLPPLLLPIKSTPSSLMNPTLNRCEDSVYDSTRPYPCSHCTKNFKRQDDLNRHMRTHTGEKPFACNECDKRFMRSDHLKKHMKTHTRVR